MHIYQVTNRLCCTVLFVLILIMFLTKAEANIISIDFTSVPYSATGSQNLDSVFQGSIKFDDSAVFDINPDSRFGFYRVVTDFSFNLGGEKVSLENISSTIRVTDEPGGDFFFVYVPLDQAIPSFRYKQFVVDIQNEYAPDYGKMFSSDALPTSTFLFPEGSLAQLRFEKNLGRNSNGDFRIAIDTFTITSTPVPVPSAIWLFGSGLLCLIGIKKNKLKISV